MLCDAPNAHYGDNAGIPVIEGLRLVFCSYTRRSLCSSGCLLSSIKPED